MEKLTPSDINEITDLDLAFGTTRFLPEHKDIPKEFFASDNIYSRLAEAIMFGHEMPAGDIVFNEGFQEVFLKDNKGVRFVRAHLASWAPKHEDKIAGVAYLISQMMSLTEANECDGPSTRI